MSDTLNRYFRQLKRIEEKNEKDIELEKEKFIKLIKNGLGEKMLDINTYVKKEPSFYQRLKSKLKKIITYL